MDLLHKRVSSLPLLPTWVVSNATTTPLTLCKLLVSEDVLPRASVLVTVTISADRTLLLSFTHPDLTPTLCPVFTGLPPTISSVGCHIISLIDNSRICSYWGSSSSYWGSRVPLILLGVPGTSHIAGGPAPLPKRKPLGLY